MSNDCKRCGSPAGRDCQCGYESLQSTNKKLTDRVKTLTKNKEKDESRWCAACGRGVDWTEEIKSFKTQLAAMTKERDQMERYRLSLCGAVEQFKSERDELAKDVAQKDEEIAIEKKRCDLLATQLDKSDAEIAALNVVVGDLKGELSAIRDDQAQYAPDGSTFEIDDILSRVKDPTKALEAHDREIEAKAWRSASGYAQSCATNSRNDAIASGIAQHIADYAKDRAAAFRSSPLTDGSGDEISSMATIENPGDPT